MVGSAGLDGLAQAARPGIVEADHAAFSWPEHLKNGVGDVGVGAAAADVSAHLLAHLQPRVRVALVNEALRRADLARRTVAALEGVVFDERRLEWVEVAWLTKSFDGGDFAAVQCHRQLKAGVGAHAIDLHSAGAALAVIAALLRAREGGACLGAGRAVLSRARSRGAVPRR